MLAPSVAVNWPLEFTVTVVLFCTLQYVPAGSDVSAGTYKCTNCGYELEVGSTQHLPPCPSCSNGRYETLSGGDSAQDPYPDR